MRFFFLLYNLWLDFFSSRRKQKSNYYCWQSGHCLLIRVVKSSEYIYSDECKQKRRIEKKRELEKSYVTYVLRSEKKWKKNRKCKRVRNEQITEE